MAGLLALAGVAMSQEESSSTLAESAVGFGFRLGGFIPADSALRDNSSTWIDFAIEYEFEKSFLKTGTTYVAFDWASPQFFGGDHVATLSLNQRFYTGERRYAAGGSAYFFLGAGVSMVNAGGNGSGLAVRGGLGTEFRGNTFLEVGANLSAKIHGVNPSGIMVSLGFRFR